MKTFKKPNIKMSDSLFQDLAHSSVKVIDSIGKDKVLEAYKANPVGTMWNVYHEVNFQKHNDDSHPSFKRDTNRRVIEHDRSFDAYAGGLNDSHIQSALKSIFSQIYGDSKMADGGAAGENLYRVTYKGVKGEELQGYVYGDNKEDANRNALSEYSSFDIVNVVPASESEKEKFEQVLCGNFAEGGDANYYKNSLGYVEVIFENPKYNYSTNVSGTTTEKEARDYFVGQHFNVEPYPSEKMAKAIDIKFHPKGTYAEGGEITEAALGNIHKNVMGTISFDLKLKGMRKPQDFIVYPISKDEAGKIITIQSDTRIGTIDLENGLGAMSQPHSSGAYFMHLSMDKKTHFKLSDLDTQALRMQIFTTAGSAVGSRGIVSENLGAEKMLGAGGSVKSGMSWIITGDLI